MKIEEGNDIYMDLQIINNIKSLGIDMIDNARSGHPGIVLGAAPILYALYANHLNINNNDDKWINRDRFVMSAGHGSALLYSTLYMAGFNLDLEDLKHFRRANFKTPGHPEVNITPGVDASTGPLGEGFGIAVGMALAGKIQKNMTKFNGGSLIDYNVYALCGDGDMMEGITSEAASFAGSLCLDNLIVLYDSNNITLDGNTNVTFKENVLKKFKSMGWNTIYVKDGSNVKKIDMAINKAKKSNKPTIIEIKTIIGRGSLNENNNSVHGSPLGKDDIRQLKQKLGVPINPFYINEEARSHFKKMIIDRGSKKYNKWASDYQNLMNGNIKIDKDILWLFGQKNLFDISSLNVEIDDDLKEPLRVSNGKIMNEIVKHVPNFIGGSCDLFSSTKTYLYSNSDISKNNFDGKNIYFGIREHAMGAILNGMALCNLKPYGATFLSFSDFLKPAIRLGALMKLPVTYIFTHDSIDIGEDGPTHQPIEQLTMLRSIPNLFVFRPCDMHELLGCWNLIINNSISSALVLSRNDVPLLSTTSANLVINGAYIVRKENAKLDGIIVATGSDVATSCYIANDFYNRFKIDLRVVSMPCVELFMKKDFDYKNIVLPKNIKTFVLEAATSYELEQFATNHDYLLNIDKFGISGLKDEVSRHVDFDYQTLEKKIYILMQK